LRQPVFTSGGQWLYFDDPIGLCGVDGDRGAGLGPAGGVAGGSATLDERVRAPAGLGGTGRRRGLDSAGRGGGVGRSGQRAVTGAGAHSPLRTRPVAWAARRGRSPVLRTGRAKERS